MAKFMCYCESSAQPVIFANWTAPVGVTDSAQLCQTWKRTQRFTIEKRNTAHSSAQATDTVFKLQRKGFPYPEYHTCHALCIYPVWKQNRPDILIFNEAVS